MFERLTDRARMAMAQANQEAQRLNHEYIGPEHLLLGLLKNNAGVALEVLSGLDVDAAQMTQQVDAVLKRGGPKLTLGKLPQTPAAKKVVEHAILEARRLQDSYVGTEHLLLGLLSVADTVAWQVLTNLGLALDRVRDEVLRLRSQHPERYSLAEQPIESTQMPGAHFSPSTGQLLLFLIANEKSLAARALRELGVPLDDVRASVQRLIDAGESDPA